MSNVTTLVPKKGGKKTVAAALSPALPPEGYCKCEDVQLLVGVLHVTARCPSHRTPVPDNMSRFHIDRDLVAAINADYAMIEMTESDRGAASIAVFCAAIMGLMRLIDSAPALDLLLRLHREAELVLRSLIEMPRMQSGPQPAPEGTAPDAADPV